MTAQPRLSPRLPPRLLCISNGHGEDAIALRILTAVRSQRPDIELMALPIVGEGLAFRKHDISLIGTPKTLPSGGFIYMDSHQLARDLQGGLIQLTRSQLQALKLWAKPERAKSERAKPERAKIETHHGGMVLAVGDVIPMAFAWWSRLPYIAVGTAKSAYYLRDEQGPLPGLPWYAGWSGSIYLPWERWLMGHDRCRAAIVRDELTAQELQQFNLAPVYPGNPMMDRLTPTAEGAHLQPPTQDALTILLLPGSRAPEAHANWQIILKAVEGVLQQFQPRWIHCLGAIAPSLELAAFKQSLAATGWQPDTNSPAPYFHKGHSSLQLTQTAYADCLHLADVAIALAGTATEQFVGLGKPAFTTPGPGPQFNLTFAKRQTRLLGPSVTLVEKPTEIGAVMAQVLQDPNRLAVIHQNGRRRMGKPGAAAAIADIISKYFS